MPDPRYFNDIPAIEFFCSRTEETKGKDLVLREGFLVLLDCILAGEDVSKDEKIPYAKLKFRLLAGQWSDLWNNFLAESFEENIVYGT